MTEFEDMTAAHAADIAAIERATFAEPWSEKSIAALADDPKAIARVLVRDGKVAAYYSMYVVAGEGFVNNLAVAPDMRGRGVGNALMQDMMYAASLSGDGGEIRIRHSARGQGCGAETVSFFNSMLTSGLIGREE